MTIFVCALGVSAVVSLLASGAALVPGTFNIPLERCVSVRGVTALASDAALFPSSRGEAAETGIRLLAGVKSTTGVAASNCRITSSTVLVETGFDSSASGKKAEAS
jgi:hypothetical protein